MGTLDSARDFTYKIKITRPPEDLQEILKARAFTMWPQAHLDTDFDGTLGNFFFFEDRAARDSWEQHGRTSKNDTQLVLVSVSEEHIQITVSPRQKEQGLDFVQHLTQAMVRSKVS